MLIIGVCGGSGSGKSTLARGLAGAIDGECLLLSQDCYYKNHASMTFEEREKINYDEPEAFEHGELYEDMMALREGRPITRKGYDYALHLRSDSEELITPPQVLILEGIHSFYDPRIRNIMDLRVFVQVDQDVCLLRRVKRDIEKRGRHIQGIYDQYLSTVKPMYEQYVKGYCVYADILVTGGGKNKRSLDVLAAFINSKIQG